MTSIHVEVTAEHIAAAGPWDPEDNSVRPGHRDPIERAIADVAGVDVICDSDVPDGEMATIGQNRNTLVANLPPEVTAFVDRYYLGEPIEPFAFEVEIEDWLIVLVGRAGVDESDLPT